jgi:hypothetical protein
VRLVGWREVGGIDLLVLEARTNLSNLDTTYNKILEIYSYRKLWEGGQVGGVGGNAFLSTLLYEKGPTTYSQPRGVR